MSADRPKSSWFMGVVRLVQMYARGRHGTQPDWAPLFTQGRFSAWERSVPQVAGRRSLPFRVGEHWIERDGGRGIRACGASQDIDIQGLMLACNQLAPRMWPEAIGAHFDRILSLADQTRRERLPEITAEEGRARMLPVLHSSTYSVHEMHLPSRTPASWLSWHLGVQHDNRMCVPDEGLLARWGLSVEEGLDLALRNLASHPNLEFVREPSEHPAVELLYGPIGGEARVVLQGLGLEGDGGLGHLIAFPIPGKVLVGRVEDTGLAEVVHAMLLAALRLRDVSAGGQVFRYPGGPLGDRLYWWRRGRLQGELHIGRFADTGECAGIPTEELHKVVFQPLGLGDQIVYRGHEECACGEFNDVTFERR